MLTLFLMVFSSVNLIAEFQNYISSSEKEIPYLSRV